MKGMRWRMTGLVAAAAGILVAGGARAQTRTWTGGAGAGNGQWTSTANWLDASAPANPTGNTIAYNDTGTSVTGIVNAAGDTWQVGAVNVNNTAGTHTLDLAGKTLALTGNLTLATPTASTTASATVTNGTLKLGAPGAPVNLTVGSGSVMGSTRTGNLTLAPGTTLDANLTTLTVGGGSQGSRGKLDLRGATIAGRVLKATTVALGIGSWSNNRAEILLNGDTGIDRIECRYLDMGNMFDVVCYIGDPANSYNLPPDVDIVIGSEAEPGWLRMARKPRGAVSRIVASSGGAFTARVSEVTIGEVLAAYSGDTATPTLDLRAMTGFLLACSGTVAIPAGGSDGVSLYVCTVRLPAGTASAADLRVGTPHLSASSSALLELNGTVFAVGNSATVGAKGTVTANVAGKSCGLDLALAAGLAVTDPGRIRINFNAAQAEGESGEYWGLRWAGDRRTTLAGLIQDGRMVVTVGAGLGTANVWYDGAYTYVALRDVWPPSAIAADRTVEIMPPAYTTVVIRVDDVDVSPPDASVTNRTISCVWDEDADPSTVTVTTNAAATHEITLTLDSNSGESASDTCNLNVIVVPTPTAGAVTWSGLARTALMPRPEWLWGKNWVGDVAPTNPTAATITFGTEGVSRPGGIETDRQIGGLSVNNASGTHTLNLGGHTLALTGNLTVASPTAGTTASATVTNGTLKLGAPGAPVNLSVGTAGAQAQAFTGNLTLAPGTTLDANLATLRVGGGSSQGTLDLRGATIAGGVLKATTIEMGQGSWFNYYAYLYLDDTTDIDKIECINFDMGVTYDYTCRLGDPMNGHKLPPGIDIAIGTPATPGRLRMSTGGARSAYSSLIAASGGDFTAYLSYATIGEATGDAGSAMSNPVFDLSAMDSVALTCTGTMAIPGGSGTTRYIATVKLPPGTASAATLQIGTPDNANSTGLLELNGTELAVATSAEVGARGTLTVNVGDVSCGLDLAEAATLAIADGRTIQLNFTQAPASTANGHYGLRWGGDKTDALQDLVDAGTLAWTDTAVDGKVEIYTSKGATHIGIPPPRGTVFTIR